MQRISKYELREICTHLSYTSIFRLHATGYRGFSAKILLPCVDTVDEYESCLLDSRANPRRLAISSKIVDWQKLIIGKTLISLCIPIIDNNTLRLIPSTITDLACKRMKRHNIYKFHEGITTLSLNNITHIPTFVFPETLTGLVLLYTAIWANITSPVISFPSKLKNLHTNITIGADNPLPLSLTELHAFDVTNDINMKAFPLLRTILIGSKSFDINRCTDKVTVGAIENDRLHLLKSDRKFTSLSITASHCGIPAIANKYKDLEKLFVYCDIEGICINDECTRSHEIVLDFSPLTKLTSLRYSQGINGHYDEHTTIPLKLVPGGFPSSLVYVELDTECFNLYDILLFNDEIESIIIMTSSLTKDNDKVDLRSKYKLRNLDITATDGVGIDYFIYPPTLNSLELTMNKQQLKDVQEIPSVEYLQLHIEGKDIHVELVRICDIIPSSVINFDVSHNKYKIKQHSNLVSNKWTVDTKFPVVL